MKLLTYFRAMEIAYERIETSIEGCMPDFERYGQSVRQSINLRDGLIKRMTRMDMERQSFSHSLYKWLEDEEAKP
jgi:hypothetical protein